MFKYLSYMFIDIVTVISWTILNKHRILRYGAFIRSGLYQKKYGVTYFELLALPPFTPVRFKELINFHELFHCLFYITQVRVSILGEITGNYQTYQAPFFSSFFLEVAILRHPQSNENKIQFFSSKSVRYIMKQIFHVIFVKY